MRWNSFPNARLVLMDIEPNDNEHPSYSIMCLDYNLHLPNRALCAELRFINKTYAW